MRATLKGASKLAASLTLAGGLLLAAALPAAAASPNRSNAAQATGLISGGPLAPASYPGTSPVTVAHANIAGLLTTDAVTDTAGPTSASTRVANPAATLTGGVGLTATSVTSSCTFNTNTGAVTGTATINNGRVTVGGDKGYDTAEFVDQCRHMNVTPHVAQNTARPGGSAIDARTTRHAGYDRSQKKRKRIEECFGC